MGYFNKIRINLSHKLLRFAFEKKVDNRYLLWMGTMIYYLLVRGVYVVRHKNAGHHFVPRFILKKFKIKDKGLIFEYNMQHPMGRQRSILKHACVLPNLYTTTDKKTKLPSDFLEDALFAELIENYAPRIIDQIIIEPFSITYLEESLLAIFIAFQYTRTPKFIREINIFLTFLVKERQVKLSEIESKNFFKSAFIEDRYSVSRKDFNLFKEKNNLLLKGAKNVLISFALSIANYISKPIYQKKMAIMRINDPDYFVIPDHPVVMANLETHDFVGPMLWELDKAIVFMPITPHRAVYYYNGDSDMNPNYNTIMKFSVFNFDENIYSDRKSKQVQNFFYMLKNKIVDN